MVERVHHKEDMTVINMHLISQLPNTEANINRIEGRNWITIRRFQFPFSIMDTTTKQKTNKETEDLKNIID